MKKNLKKKKKEKNTFKKKILTHDVNHDYCIFFL